MHGLVCVGREPPPGGRHVRRLRVVDIAHARHLADRLQPMGDPRERSQPVGDRLVVDPRLPRGHGRRGGVLPVVRAPDQRLGRQRVVRTELDPVQPQPRGTTQPGRARRSGTSPRGRPRTSRAGRDDPAPGSARPRRRRRASRRPRAGTTTARTTTHSDWPTDERGVPTFPATSTSRPAARKIAPSSSTVVVFPFVPVTPITRVPSPSCRQPISTSDHTGTPHSRAASTSGASPGTPGLLTRRSTPSRRSRSYSFPSSASTSTAWSPRSASRSATAAPERARP